MACLVLGVSAWLRHADELRWQREFQQLGAYAVTTGYENTSSGIGRVPVIGEIVTHRTQVELFLYDPASVDAVLDKAAECPNLGRIWVDLTELDRPIGDRIRQRLPGVDVQFHRGSNIRQVRRTGG
jgi:hypothetical protein